MSKEENANALRNMKRLSLGCSEVDWRNPAHMQAYLALSATQKRINAAALLAFIKAQESEVVQGASMETTFWVVPKSALPDPTPEIAAAMVTEQELLERGAGMGTVDCENCYIIDQCIPRSSLPKGVSEVRYSLSSVNKYRRDAVCGGEAPPPPSNPTNPVNPPSQGMPSSPATLPAIEDDPASSKQRVLKRNTSELPMEGELTVEQTNKKHKDLLKALVANIQDAVGRQMWFDDDPCADTVWFWTKQCMTTATTANEHNKTVLEQFCRFLTKMILDNKVFTHLPKFVPFFEALNKSGAKVPSIVQLIVALAKTSTDAAGELDAGNLDADVRVRFYNSELWIDYVHQRRLRLCGEILKYQFEFHGVLRMVAVVWVVVGGGWWW